MTVYESLNVILSILLQDNNTIPSKNGFPAEFNLNNNQINKPFMFSHKAIFPYSGSINNLFFHDTDWSSAISINKWIFTSFLLNFE